MKVWTGIKLVLWLGLVAVAGVAMYSCDQARAALAVSQIERDSVIQLNDSSVAALANERLEHDKFVGVLKANNELNAKLLASVRIRVPARDTVLVHDTLTTVTMVDSTRVATFRDSTFAGVIEGQVTAPPCCAPLVMDTLKVHRPAFEPTVALSQIGNHQVWLVVWQGERAEVEAPYAQLPRAPRRFTTFTEASINDLGEWSVSGGGQARAFWGLTGFAQATQRLGSGESLRLEAGVRKEW